MKLMLAFILWSAACLAQDDKAIPKVFVATIQPGLKPAHALQLDGTTLVYTIRFGTDVETQRITPTVEQWSAFRRALDTQKVWRWRAKYTESRRPESTIWSLKIEYADRSLVSTGTAAFPDRSTDRTLPRYAFNHYQLALQDLIGRPFGRGVKPIEVFDLAELRLVDTHPAEKDEEQWADFRDPKGKVHRALLHEAVGGRGTLEKVGRASVSLSVLTRNTNGEWTQQERILGLASTKK